jgi:hypothetical protein
MGTKHHEDIEVAITNTGNHDLLLGTDWLKAHNWGSLNHDHHQACFSHG